MTMSSGTLMRSREPLGVVWTLAKASYIPSWKCFRCVWAFLDQVSTVSQVCDEAVVDPSGVFGCPFGFLEPAIGLLMIAGKLEFER